MTTRKHADVRAHFNGRKMLIATMHQKDKALSDMLEERLGVTCFTLDHFDTDRFGTFSGEVKRRLSPLDTARDKCLSGMEAANCDLAVASEGSFGPHPSLFFVPADEETLILIDKKNDLEISATEISTETNFNGATITTLEELDEFAKRARFPSHALIVKEHAHGIENMHKGIKDWNTLNQTFIRYQSLHGSAYVETDMRAYLNPTRMQVIQKAGKRLIGKISSCCPNCSLPGFSITSIKKGLPCSQCNSPCNSPITFVSSCQKCQYIREEIYPTGKTTEDPMFCDVCNP